mgnify:CR=1 FL=1
MSNCTVDPQLVFRQVRVVRQEGRGFVRADEVILADVVDDILRRELLPVQLHGDAQGRVLLSGDVGRVAVVVVENQREIRPGIRRLLP